MSDKGGRFILWLAVAMFAIVVVAVCTHGVLLGVHGQRLRDVEARLKALEDRRDE